MTSRDAASQDHSGRGAFVGISLDSRRFTRDWFRRALPCLVSRHGTVLLVLADSLLRYTRSAARERDVTVLHLEEGQAAAASRRDDTMRAVARAIGMLPADTASRIAVRGWSDFEDAAFAHLWRSIQIANATVAPFRDLVRDVASRHARATNAALVPHAAEAGRAFILDEIAMCLRITEVAGWIHEYHPASDLPVLAELYDDQFRRHGLTVEALTGAPRRRAFRVFDVADVVAGSV